MTRRRATVAATSPAPLKRIRTPDVGAVHPAPPARSRGRPPRADGAGDKVTVRLSPIEQAEAAELAANRGVTVPDVLRSGEHAWRCASCDARLVAAVGQIQATMTAHASECPSPFVRSGT